MKYDYGSTSKRDTSLPVPGSFYLVLFAKDLPGLLVG